METLCLLHVKSRTTVAVIMLGAVLMPFVDLACRLPRVAAAAAAIACHWQQLGGLGGVPFALPALSPSGRPSKGTLLPSAHQTGSTGLPTATSAAAHPLGQGTSSSGATKGQDLALPQGQDQRLMHPMDSQGGGHSDGVLTSSGSHEVADRYFTSSFTLFILRDRDVVDLSLDSQMTNEVHNDSVAPNLSSTRSRLAQAWLAWRQQVTPRLDPDK